jgi:hypothetical protein
MTPCLMTPFLVTPCLMTPFLVTPWLPMVTTRYDKVRIRGIDISERATRIEEWQMVRW